MTEAQKRAESAIFGAVDGLTMSLGLIAGMLIAGYAHGAVWHSALSGGLAELAGMTIGKRRSDGSSWTVSLTCGGAGLAGGVLPALPFLIWGGSLALAVALVIMLVIAIGTAIIRPDQKTLPAVIETLVLLVIAAALTVAGGFT